MKKILPGLYLSQRVNAELPLVSCNVTSVLMAMDASRHPPAGIAGIPDGVAGAPAIQPADYLNQLMASDEAMSAMRLLCPWFFDKDGKPTVRPAEAPLMLAWMVSRAWGAWWMLFHDSSQAVETLADSIDMNRAAVVSGSFTPSGHYVAVVGYGYVPTLRGTRGAVTSMVVRDPWGDWTKGYAEHYGNEVEIPREDFIRLVKPAGGNLKSALVAVA